MDFDDTPDEAAWRAEVREHNLAVLAERAFERHGDYPSLFFEGRWLTSGEIHERSARVAAGLRAHGVRPGDRVVVMTMNTPEVAILDPAGRAVPAGEDGEICVRGPGVMLGYWNDPELTAQTVRDGWLHTGDVGRLDEDGFLYVADRMKDLIIRGGFNVFPRDVEDVLLEHPAVQLAACVGRPDAEHGEEVVAVVQLAPGRQVSGAELVEYARARMAKYKYPREVTVLDAVPLTSVKKLDRKAVRTLVRGDLGISRAP